MKTVEDVTRDLYDHGQDAESFALTLIRCLDYDRDLVLDHEAYRKAVHTILDAWERARDLRMADLQDNCDAAWAALREASDKGRAKP